MQMKGCIQNIGDLGFDPMTAAASLAAGIFGPSGNGGGGGAPAAPPPPPTSISPAFQQAFTPQVSPVIQTATGSPGATQTGAPTQYAPGGQAAIPGAMPGSAPLIPAPAGAGAMPGAFRSPFDQPVFQSRDDYSNLIMVGIVAVSGLVALNMMKKQPATARAKSRRKPRSRKK